MTLHYTKEEAEQYEKELKVVNVHTSMNFLNAHNGIRFGSLHLILGTTGGGKTTLTRTLLRDFLFKKENQGLTIGLWLSEESLKSYKMQLSQTLPSHDVLLSTKAFSEMDHENVSEMHFIEWINTYQPNILIIDNITTSKFYMDLPAKDQARFATKLKSITAKHNIATILIAHTDAEVHDGIERLININDIRGSKTIANLVEFAYILQRFELGKTFFPTIRTVKHRSQELEHSLHFLHYEKMIRAFTKDSPLEFEKFKEIFNDRNRLKK
jgi:predicted ATP-dependent serine protease